MLRIQRLASRVLSCPRPLNRLYPPTQFPLKVARNLSSNIFDPSIYAKTRLPITDAETLPGHCYTSEEWYHKELTNVFKPSWTFVGRADEISEPGQYLTIDTQYTGPIVVIRDSKDNEIRAFANVCRHRGAKLLDNPHGCVKRSIRCPYHSWVFDTKGNLKGAPGMVKNSKFKVADWPLKAVRLDNYKGFLYVTTDPDIAPQSERLGNMGSLVTDQYNFEDMVTVGRREYTVPCNWKFVIENTAETYHTSTVHSSTLGPMKSWSTQEQYGKASEGHWDAVCVPTKRSVVPLKEDPAPFPEISTLRQGKDKITHFVLQYPNLQMNCTFDCMWWMRVMPTSKDECAVTLGYLFPRATTEMPDFEEHLERYLYRWDVAVQEDNEISLNQQAGLSSPLHVPGPFYVLQEFSVLSFNQWLLDRVLDDN